MKICVYAIAKNEEKFVDRWMDCVKEADNVYVLDTGSTDTTVEKLKKRGAIVECKKVFPWRFDVARNLSLDMVPADADICVCLDLDEVIESGWRDKLESIWKNGITRIKYNYIWSHDAYGNPAVNFYSEKIHSRQNFKWVNPVHEILVYEGKENVHLTECITVRHYPDNNKSRSSYLPLLELSVKEDPYNDRNMHYLGREYMYYKKWNKCIDTLIKHLELETATWKDERGASMRFISRAYRNLGRKREAKMWLDLAKIETPYLREPFVESAFLEFEERNFDKVIENLKIALNILKIRKNYINEPFCYDDTIYDLMSVACFYTGKKAEAIYYLEKALELNPDNERLKNNMKLMKKS